MDLNARVKNFSNWGYRIIRVRGYYFLRRGSRLYSFPPESTLSPYKGLLRRLRLRSRLTSILLETPRKDMVEYIHTSDNYSLDSFSDEMRWFIRTSLNNCEFRRPPLYDLVRMGMKINRALSKKNSHKGQLLNRKRHWKKAMRSIYFHPGFNILAAYYEDRMVGYLITYLAGKKHHVLKAGMDRLYAGEAQPLAGLLYTRINDLVEEYGEVTISYGVWQSRGNPELTDLMRGMLFKQNPFTRGYILRAPFTLRTSMYIWLLVKLMKKRHISGKRARRAVEIYQGYRVVKRYLREKTGSSGNSSGESKKLGKPRQASIAS